MQLEPGMLGEQGQHVLLFASQRCPVGSHATVTPAKPALLACWPAQSNANPRSHARQRNVRRARTFESWSVTTTICLLSARSIPTIALLIGTNTRSRESGSPAITVVRERCAIARRGAGGVGVVARMARRVGAPTATNPGATRACYDLTEPCP